MAKQMIANGIPVLIVEPTKLLTKQIQDNLIGDMHIDQKDIGVFSGSVSPGVKKRAVDKPILIVTADSLRTLYESKGLAETPGKEGYRPFVIIDETHERVQGPLLSQYVEMLKKHSAVVGLTGTDAGAYRTLYDKQVPVYNLALVDGIETGIPTMVNHAKARLVDVRVDDEWYKSWLETHTNNALDKHGNAPKEMLDFLARNSALISAANRIHFNYEDQHLGPIYKLPTLSYVYRTDAAKAGAQQANKMAKEMGIEDFHAEHISGEMSKKDIDKILRRFAAGEVNMLWNDRLIGLGYNERSVTVIHDLRNSTVEQQFGRALRSQGEDYEVRHGGNKVALGISYRALTSQGDFVPTYTTVDVLGGEPKRYDRISFPTPPLERFPKQGGKPVASSFDEPLSSLHGDQQPPPPNELSAPSPGEAPMSLLDESKSSTAHEFFPSHERLSSKEYQYMDGIVIHATTSQTREVANAIKKRRDELMGRVPENWMTVNEAEQLTGIDKQRWLEVANHIKPNQSYTSQGFPPKAGDKELVFGSNLARKGPRGWILHTSLVEGVQAVELMKKEGGVETVSAHARASGVKTSELKNSLRMLRGGSSAKVGELAGDQHSVVESSMPNTQDHQVGA